MSAADVEPAAISLGDKLPNGQDSHLRSSVTSVSSAISLELTKPGSSSSKTEQPSGPRPLGSSVGKRPSLEDRLAARASVRGGGGLRNAAMSSRLLGGGGRVASQESPASAAASSSNENGAEKSKPRSRRASLEDKLAARASVRGGLRNSNASLELTPSPPKEDSPQKPTGRRSLEEKLAARASVKGGGLRNSALSSRMLGSGTNDSSLQDAAKAAQESMMGLSNLSTESVELTPSPPKEDSPQKPKGRRSLEEKLAARASVKGGGLRNSALSSRMLGSGTTDSSLQAAAKAAQESDIMGDSNVSLELLTKAVDNAPAPKINKRPSLEDMIAARASVRGGLRSNSISSRNASMAAQQTADMGDSLVSLEDAIVARKRAKTTAKNARPTAAGGDDGNDDNASVGTSKSNLSLGDRLAAKRNSHQADINSRQSRDSDDPGSSMQSSDLSASIRLAQESLGGVKPHHSMQNLSSHSAPARPGVRRSASRPVISSNRPASFVMDGGSLSSSMEENLKARLSKQQRGSLARRSSSRPGSMVSFASSLTEEKFDAVIEESMHGSVVSTAVPAEKKKTSFQDMIDSEMDDAEKAERGEGGKKRRRATDGGELMQSKIVDKNDHVTLFRKYAKYFCVGLLIIVILVVAVSVQASREVVETQIEAMATAFPSAVPSVSPTASSAPSMVPSTSPTTSLKLMTRYYLGNISDASALEDPSTPQGKAFRWIYEVDRTMMNETNFIQRYTLAVLYYSTKGELWNVCSEGDFACNYGFHYLSNVDECLWFKNKCNKNGQIIDLTFAYLDADNNLEKTGNNLQGPIPSEISQLTELQILNFDSNKLTGTIPESFGDLTKLYSFITNKNPLQSPLPESFFNLKRLYILSMVDNLLTGSIPTRFGEMTELGVLRLDQNALTGDVPNELGQMSKLEALTLEQNNLNGTFHEGIYDCTLLRQISIYTNDLTGTIPSKIVNLKRLESYDVASNSMSGTLPSEIGNMRSLARIYLKGNRFDGTIPESLGNLKNAEQLEFSANSFTGTMPDSICALNLKRLEADCEEVTCECCTVCLVDEV